MQHSQTFESASKRTVGGIEHPPVKGKFFAMSLFFFTLDCLRELSHHKELNVSWPTPKISELVDALDGLCSRRWNGVSYSRYSLLYDYTEIPDICNCTWTLITIILLLMVNLIFQFVVQMTTFTVNSHRIWTKYSTMHINSHERRYYLIDALRVSILSHFYEMDLVFIHCQMILRLYLMWMVVKSNGRYVCFIFFTFLFFNTSGCKL